MLCLAGGAMGEETQKLCLKLPTGECQVAFTETSEARHSAGTLGDTELAVGVLSGRGLGSKGRLSEAGPSGLLSAISLW